MEKPSFMLCSLGNRLKSILLPAKLAQLLSFALVIFTSNQVDATVITKQQSDLEKRIELVRDKLLQNTGANEAKADDLKDDKVAQWYNWPNWPNWNNWGNWGNWPNWYNY